MKDLPRVGHHPQVGASEYECAPRGAPSTGSEVRRDVTIRRRAVLAAMAGAVLHPARAWAAAEHEIKAFTVGRKGVPASRFAILVPKHLPKGAEVGLVVALHGLGETHDEALGIRAWPELYGLDEGYRRLRQAPLARTSLRKDFTEERLRELNAALAREPFAGLCIACPFTPNPKKLGDRKREIAAYAAWLDEVVIAEAGRQAPLRKGRAARSLIGCSMGATVALEVLASGVGSYGGIGFVQGALSRDGAARNAERIATAAGATPVDVELLSSEQDPFLDGHRALATELGKRKIDHDLRVLPGPHDQPWLREAGAVEMLFHQSRKRNRA